MDAEHSGTLIQTLSDRFAKRPEHHPGVDWADVQDQLLARSDALTVLAEMERTGGEPDVVSFADAPGQIVFCDCSAESPAGRRSVCFDQAALDSRKENKPVNSAMAMAASIGIEILNEAQYRDLQTRGQFDRKTSSWIATPDAIRKLGGALFCDRRYDQVFLYHNGAESYYAARGFRGRIIL